MSKEKLTTFSHTVYWNVFLLTGGAFLFALGANGIAQQHGFISGGLYGTGMLIFNTTGLLSAPIWYFAFSLPVFVWGWKALSRRFLFYSLYGFAAVFVIAQFVVVDFGITDPFLATVACAVFVGAGGGLVIRSLGSDGGTTIIAIILNQRYGIRVGQTFFIYNSILFLAGALTGMSLEKVLYSLIMVYIASNITDYFGSMFNERKMAWIISSRYKEIAPEIFNRLHRGATFVHATGAFSKVDRTLLLTVVHNYQIKALEEIVFSLDDKAFVIIENTFNVLGSGFSKRKLY
jgi:uncharacterized membrane-anchored protein YitT (DUF2179 family)